MFVNDIVKVFARIAKLRTNPVFLDINFKARLLLI